MATKNLNAMVEATILRHCVFGEAGDVVTLAEADAAVGVEHGMLDTHPDAVKAVKTSKE